MFNREYRVVTGKYQNLPVTICSSGMGGPAAAIAIEELYRIGAKVIIRVGSCGANKKAIRIGDVIIPDSVIRQDHTCLDYVPLAYPAVADRQVVEKLIQSAKAITKENKTNFFVGPTVSVDALYSPKTKASKEFWKNFGALGQDMETSTVVTLSRLRGIKAGAILLVVDQEGEKNIASKIAQYSLEAKSNKGTLVTFEKMAARIALQALVLISQEK
jgi:uridine phosphorylase